MSTKVPGQTGKSATMVAPKPSSPKTKEKENKMHRRSRSGIYNPLILLQLKTNVVALGCFTCRLRRKKCDEGKGQCRACKHLGLKCEYKRPTWWTNNEQRKQQKEHIKSIIKRTKISEKTAAQQMGSHMGADTPPGLSHSLPTSATYSVTPRTRAPSVDSPYSPEQYDFNGPPLHEHFDIYGQPHVLSPPYDANPHYQTYPDAQYEVDVKTDSQIYVNDVPTRKDSSTSTFSTYYPPPMTSATTPFHDEAWVHQGLYEDTDVFGADEGFDFDFGYDAPLPSQTVQIDVDDCDRALLDHFIDTVLRLIFPILEVNRPGSARSDVVLPALESNKCYLHCCLSVAAIHLKSIQAFPNEQIENDIMRHRYTTVQELCEALSHDEDHQKILEATLGMIFFQCSVGRPNDSLPDIPWHQHFQAGESLVRKLKLPYAMENVHGPNPRPPFNMTLTSWIDILGATMLGRSPQFADTYREKHMNGTTSGLCELMGCDDRVMYMISEIACLDALKVSGQLEDDQICHHVKQLGEYLNATDPKVYDIDHAMSSTGAIRPEQLSKNITAMFRIAARIYLCGLVPGSSRHDSTMFDLVTRLAGVLEYIPPGFEGFDRSLVWPLLIGGSMSTPNSPFRQVFNDRLACLGEYADLGSFGRMVRLLQEVWHQSDHAGEGQNVHWRDVMQQKGWDYLLI